MKIKILSSASRDLTDGYWFYEKQTEGIGTYFLDSLFPTLIPWPSMQAFTQYILENIIDCYQNVFRLPFTTALRNKQCWYMRSLIAVEDLPGSGRH